jgi:predicted ATPase/DNA-binding SARP family transcriptional activator
MPIQASIVDHGQFDQVPFLAIIKSFYLSQTDRYAPNQPPPGEGQQGVTLKIYLLGQFKLEHDGQPLELPSRPAQSLFAFLVLYPNIAHRREKLAGMLWPESEEDNARGYLRQALWRIRKTLESASLNTEEYLDINKISVCFLGNNDHVLDVASLIHQEDVRTREFLIEAVSAYQGELLPGFYDDWVGIERDRLQAVFHKKMNSLIDALVQDGAWDQILEWAEHWIRHSHAPEPAFGAMMKAYANLGDPTMLRATYERCVVAVQRDLGIAPSKEIQQLFDRLSQHDLEPISLPLSTTRVRPRKEPPFLTKTISDQVEELAFVARETELATLDEHLEEMLMGKGKVVFITGEVGSGKTALLDEFTRRSLRSHSDLAIASGNCNAHTGMGDPYLPLREILCQLTGDVEGRLEAGAITRLHAHRLWTLLPESIPALLDAGPGLIGTFIPSEPLFERASTNPPDREDWQLRLKQIQARGGTSLLIPSPQQSELFELFTRFLQSLSSEVPLVVVLDDLQWADAGSINLLFHIGRQISNCKILILGAYRQEDVAAGRDGGRHPLESILNEFQREFGTITLDVGKVDRRAFIEALLDSEPNKLGQEFRDMLFHQTQGHPLFTIELLRGMQERGDISPDADGRWVEGAQLDWESMPARVEAVIAERVGRLPISSQTILRVASVEGETFTAEVISRILGQEEDVILTQLSGELDRKHRLIRADSIQRIDSQLISTYRFRHMLFQRYLYSTLDEVERVHLHERIGKELEQLNEPLERLSEVALQLARHYEEAGIPEKAIRALHLAGDRAIQLFAHREGIAHLERALNLLRQLPDSPERDQQELDLQLSIGIVWKYNWPSPQGRAAIDRSRELSLRLGKPGQLSLALGELAIYHYVQAEHHQALEFAKDAYDLAVQAEDPALKAEAQWYLGFIHFCLGEYMDARAHLEQVIAFYKPEQHHRSFISRRGVDAGLSAMSYEACCLWCLGYPDQAIRRAIETISLAKKFEHPFTLADVLCYAGGMFSAMRGDVKALKEYANSLIDLSNEVSLYSGWLGMGVTYLGEALSLEGETTNAIAKIKEGINTDLSIGVNLYMPVALRALARAQANAGKVEKGLETIREAIRLSEKTGDRNWTAEFHRIEGELLRVSGDEDGAEASFLKAIEVAQHQNAKSWELRASMDLARLWQEEGKKKQAKQILSEIYGWFTEGFDTPDLMKAKALLEML